MSKHQKNFFENQDKFKAVLREDSILLFLDFDGTLAAIVDHYKRATILKESKMLLRKITKIPGCSIAIVSGRALSDVRKRVGLKSITYAGNHGLEIEGQGIQYISFVKNDVINLIKKISDDLLKNIGYIPGVLIEDKSLTLSVHYRNVKQRGLIPFGDKFLDCVRPYIKAKKIFVNEGKKVFEIKPQVKWDKGQAILWLIDHLQKRSLNKKMFPVFIGDDVTDETAFKALKNKGLCIRVGASDISAAPYFLKDIKQVTRFLKTIRDIKLNR